MNDFEVADLRALALLRGERERSMLKTLKTMCYEVVLDTGTITLQLRVENRGWQPLELTCALHTYSAVDDIDTCSISGLKDKT